MTDIPVLRIGRPRKEKGLLFPTEGSEIPFSIVEGVQEGPTLLITAGIHGSELCSIEAALRLMNLDPHELIGTLFVLPIMNFGGFRARSIYEDLKPFTIFNEDSEASKQLAVAFGLEIAVAGSGKRPVSSSSAARLGIPAITVEAGSNGLWSDDKVAIHFDGVMRVMAHLGMLRSPTPSRASEPQFVRLWVPTASSDGLWYPRRCVGMHVATNDVLGEVRDVFGDVLATVISEVSGEVLYQLTSLWVNAGEQLMGVAFR